MALGSEPATFVQKLGLKLDKWGNIKIDENYQTSDSKIYACGDLAGIRKTVAWAAYSGREAANKIIEKGKNKKYLDELTKFTTKYLKILRGDKDVL